MHATADGRHVPAAADIVLLQIFLQSKASDCTIQLFVNMSWHITD